MYQSSYVISSLAGLRFLTDFKIIDLDRLYSDGHSLLSFSLMLSTTVCEMIKNVKIPKFKVLTSTIKSTIYLPLSYFHQTFPALLPSLLPGLPYHRFGRYLEMLCHTKMLTYVLDIISYIICNYRKRLSDTWWLLSMRLRTRFGHVQYLFLCKAHRRSIEIRANQIVGCRSWIIQPCVSVTFQWKFLREPSKNIHEKKEILRSMI